MTVPEDAEKAVRRWENYLRDRNNFREISSHGGGTKAGWFRDIAWQRSPEWTAARREVEYSYLVQATLNLWRELEAVVRDEWEEEPIMTVARFAFDPDYQMYEECRPAYNRLWTESPRPHSDIHRALAMDSMGQLPVTPYDVRLLFHSEGWRLVAFRLAGMKKFTNSMIEYGDLLEADGTRASIDEIKLAVAAGFPQEKGARWLQLLYPDNKRAELYIERWSAEKPDTSRESRQTNPQTK